MDMQRDMDAMRHAQLTGGYGDPSGAGVAKTSSAFSPIQGSMLQTAAAAQAAASQGAFAMSAGSRGYSFYDPIGFPKHHSQVIIVLLKTKFCLKIHHFNALSGIILISFSIIGWIRL